MTVALAAAVALARLDRQHKEAVDAISNRLSDDNAETRYKAVSALGELGPHASAALPAILRSLSDKQAFIRVDAADAAGLIAAPSPSEETMEALAGVLKDEDSSVRSAAVRSLSSFGPQVWKTAAAVREGLLTPRDPNGDDFGKHAMELFARFDPPPIDFLAEAASDQRYGDAARIAALHQLGILQSPARSALPTIRRMLRESARPAYGDSNSIRVEAAEALLAVDPEGGPALVAPALLEYLKGSWSLMNGRAWDASGRVWRAPRDRHCRICWRRSGRTTSKRNGPLNQ